MGLFKCAGIPGDCDRSIDGGARRKVKTSVAVGYRDAVQCAVTRKHQVLIRIVEKIRIRAEFYDLHGLAWDNTKAEKENCRDQAHENRISIPLL
jgi:hypothetical protein